MVLSWIYVGFQGMFCSGGAEVEQVIPVVPWNAADCIAAKL